MDDDPPGIEGIGSEDRARHLGPSRANQSGNPENFAGSHFKLDIVEHRGMGVLRITAPG